jgi:LuxR family transcriptional regulator
MSLKAFLDFAVNAPSIEELWPAHVAKMAEYGFDRLIYGCTQHRTGTSLGDPDDFLVLSNHGEDYMKGFLDSGLFHHAPMLRWALSNDGACSWTLISHMVDSGAMSQDERRVVQFNREMGVTVGYTISFRSVSARSKAAVSLCAAPGLDQDTIDGIWIRQGREIMLINNIVHLKLLTLPYSPPNRALTKRQREVLEWVGDGKTTQDIALLMGLTSATIEKHLRRAREALSVETTAQAVLKASLHNQMFILEV